jgi:hypothetical protein
MNTGIFLIAAIIPEIISTNDRFFYIYQTMVGRYSLCDEKILISASHRFRSQLPNQLLSHGALGCG